MRRRAGIVAAPDRAAHCTAPRTAPPPTTAPGTDARKKAGAITPRTPPKTVSEQPRRRRGPAGLFSAPRSWLACGTRCGMIFPVRLAALMYSRRPVEGAASGAASAVAVFCFAFAFVFKSNHNAPRKRAVFIVLHREATVSPPPFAPPRPRRIFRE